jgi:glycosyltransferase involved in cell wall biosynthesis
MVSKPKVSVITPVFNGDEYIAETIESVLNAKTSVSIEYIVINDGSTDSTQEILAQFSERIKAFNFENGGESKSVNRGLEVATGDYVLVVSADDPILEGKLFESAIQILDANPEIVAVYPDWRVIDESGNQKREVRVEDFSREVLIGKNRTLPGPGAIFRRSTALAIGGRRTKWKYVGDYDFWLRLSNYGDFRRIPEVLAQWREHPSSTSVAQKNARMANERMQVIEDFVRESNVDPSLQSMAVSNSFYLAARLAYFDKKIDGRRLFLEGLKKSRKYPSEAHPLIVVYLLTLPVSRFLSKFIPKSLAIRTLRK